MRSQDDYLRSFAVFMTERGIVPVTDPQQIAVYDYLNGGSSRPSDIADALGFASSSLHFILDKMVDAGIIIRFKPDPIRKEVYYSNLALRIAGTTRASPQVVNYCEETFKNPDSHYTGLASVANMLESYLGEIGLNHSELRTKYVKDLAAAVKDDVGTGTLEKVMQAVKDRFCFITGYRMNVFSLNPPTIIFEGDETVRPKIDMLTGFVKEMLHNATGKNLVVKSVEDLSNDSTVMYKVQYDRAEEEPETYFNTSLHQNSEIDQFMVIEVDGGAALITNDIMIGLTEAIYERPLCITDIVNNTGMPRSTTTTNLLKLVEDGIASVFYAESGAAYYGLNCSILMKKYKAMVKDGVGTKKAVAVANNENSFMEGYLLHFLASLQDLGFDTDYLMIVLGAKYMRAAGQDGPKNFDSYFGKMSDIAKVVGLSLNVVSVYPLTIGITRESNEAIAPAMTFVKGMAHQGLEMASSGMFVRVSEEGPESIKVSFKEIYPSLSMTPSINPKDDPDAMPVKKRRTSSVREALTKRNIRSDGKPVRTMRYITGVAAVMFAVIILALAMGTQGTDNYASGETYYIDTYDDIIVMDENGDVIELPYIVKAETTVLFSIDSDAQNVGVVKSGVAYPLDKLYPCDDGLYSVKMTDDIKLETLTTITVSEDMTASIYDFGRPVGDSFAYSFDGYRDAAEYTSKAGGLWTSDNAWIVLQAPKGDYVCMPGNEGVLLDKIYVPAGEDCEVTVESMPNRYATVTLEGSFEILGQYVEEELKVVKGEDITLTFLSTDGPVKIIVEQNGRAIDLPLSEDRTVTITVEQDITISYEHVGIQ